MRRTITQRALRILEQVQSLLEKGWTQEVYARNVDGQKVDSTDPDAAFWCLTGAVSRAAMDLKENLAKVPVERELRETICSVTNLPSRSVNIPQWNDEPDRTQEEVLDVVQRTLKRLRNRQAVEEILSKEG